MRLTTIQSNVTSVAERRLSKCADAKYQTSQHRRWRAEVVVRAGGRCESPGCGRSEKRMFADHIVELKDGGDPVDPDNGQLLCGKHHSLKTARERAKRHGAVL